MKNKSIITVMILLMLATTAYSAIYYVDGNLTADCDGTSYHYDVATRVRLAGPGQIAWQKIGSANSVLVAGDTVYIRGGTYTLNASLEQNAISPVNSGSAGSPITFTNYNNEDVVFQTGRYAVYLNCGGPARGGSSNKRAYIKVSGSPGHPMTFNNFKYQLWILTTDHIEITYCTFFDRISGGGTPQGTYIYINAAYNWIHNNKFSRWGSCEPYGTDAGGPFQMGINDADDHGTQYNLVENNEMAYGGHHVAWLGGTYNIYRNNYFHNEPWCPTSSPTFATRILIQNGYAAGGDDIDGIHNLNEGNRIGYGGPKNKSEVGGNVAQVMGAYNIWRYNVWAQSYLSSVWLYCYNDYGEVTKYNHIYNNNFWKGGYGYYQDYYDPRATAPTNSWSKSFHHPVNIENDVTVASNTFKNNLFYQNNTSGNYTLGGNYDFVTSSNDYYSSVGPDRQNISNNWTDNSGDPKFVDISATADPTIDPAALWNFNLQPTSTAIDGGTYLATANGAGNNSTSLVLNTEAKDAYPASLFFYDAGNIASAWPTANVNNDWIAIGTVSNVVQISSINYSTNTITLAAPMKWSNGASIWLYKKSDGARVLYGIASDYGAHEYGTAGSDKISLLPGWNWVSFNVVPSDLSLNSIFSGNLDKVEQVKGQTQSAIRSNGAWKGDLSDMISISQYKMFKVKVSTGCTLTVTGTAVLSATPILLAGGWNWVAYLPTTSLPIATALASINGQVQEVKSLTQSATYNGTTWSGTLTQFEPGQGYAIKMSAPGILTYPASAQNTNHQN
jgi:hypothetical protein